MKKPNRISPVTHRQSTAAEPASRAADRAVYRLLPALLASGACAMSAPAHALQLGELNVESGLGQPLRASIAYALSPGEQLHDYCIYLKPSGAGMPGISRAQISLTEGRIHIRGTGPVREPMLALGLAVNCPYTANLTRSYTLMLDPVPIAETRYARSNTRSAPDRTTAEPTAAASPAAASRRPVPEAVRPPSRERIGPSSTYRVRAGDSLSSIASRIQDRPASLWTAVEILFAANPDAFIGNDMNKLKAGSVLTIPSFEGRTLDSVAADAGHAGSTTTGGIAEPANTVAYEQPKIAAAAPGPAVEAPAISAPPLETLVSRSEPVPTPGPAVAEDVPAEQPVDLRPGDVVFNAERRTVTATNSTGGGLFYWITGAGLVLGGALAFLFARRGAGRRQTPPEAPVEPEVMNEIEDDAPTGQNEILSEVDFDVSEPGTWTAVNRLDADLSEGTGLSSVAQDDDYATSGALDLEFPEDAAITVETKAPPAVTPNDSFGESTILELEVLPSDDGDEDDDYDISMIMDATQHKFSDDDVDPTELDAVAVDGYAEEVDEANQADEAEYTGEDTLNDETNYDILEQDYEDELTATQALNAEIQKAAEELKLQMSEDGDDAGDSQSAEAAAQADDDFALTAEQTALMPADGETDAGLEDTGINPALDDDFASGETAVLSADAVAIDDPADDASDDDATALISEEDMLEELPGDRTSEIPVAVVETRKLDNSGATTGLTAVLPSAENDETAELDVESGTYRTGS